MTKHLYPQAPTDRRPSPLWYFGWAAYVNRRGYLRALIPGAALAAALAAVGLFVDRRALPFALALVAAGALLFLFSLAGIYRMYGPPAARYLRRLLTLADVPDDAVIADLHIGTWRTSHLLHELRPRARLHAIDCWDEGGPPAEANVRQLHELEPRPRRAPFATAAAPGGRVPLPDGSCDAVVLGFGIHELAAGGPRERIFDEARRILRPGGKLLLFEHLVDLENLAIFGPGIDHWPRRRVWLELLGARFARVRHERARQALDLFVAS